MKTVKSTQGILFSICIAWLLGVAFVQPWGEFPLNDDWAYAQSAHSLVTHGHLDIPQGWPAMTLVSVVVWGSLFCLPFGFSFAALHLSMIVAGVIGIILTYKLIRETSSNPVVALWAAAVIAANPLYLNLSTTFMTDVFFYMMLVWTLLLSVRIVRTDRTRDFVLMLVALTIALFARQFALLLAVSFGGAYLLSRPISRRSLCRAALPALICVTALLLHQYVLYPFYGFPDLRSGYTANLVGRFHEPLSSFAFHMTGALASALVYPGLFTLPLWIFVPASALSLPFVKAPPRIWLPIASLLSFAVVWVTQIHVPFIQNVLVDFGTGPVNLHPGDLDIARIAEAPVILWQLITVLGIVSGCMLTVLSIQAGLQFRISLKQSTLENRAGLLLTLLFPILYLIVVSIVGLFDRYYLLLCPFAALFISRFSEGSKPRRTFVVAGVCVIAVTFLFAVGAARDYHGWNRARWEALDYLTNEMKIPPDRIDGGFEFNGSRLYKRDYHSPEGKSWWWVVDDEYIVSVATLKNYSIVRSIPFDTVLPWTVRRSMNILERDQR